MLRIALCSSLVAAMPFAALAQDASLPDVSATILPGWRTASGTQMAALALKLPPGWHTYWRSPGEAGIPPRFDWSGSANLESVVYHWPAPAVFDLNGYRTIGYEDALVLPIEFRPTEPGAPIHAAARIQLGVCNEVCVPVELEVAGNLAAGAHKDPAIVTALGTSPSEGGKAGVTASRCAVTPLEDGVRVTNTVSLPRQGAAEFAVIEAPSADVWVQTVSSSRNGRDLTTVVDMVPPDAQPFALDRSGIVITVFGGARPVEVKGCTG